jgi:hypothetical protein
LSIFLLDVETRYTKMVSIVNPKMNAFLPPIEKPQGADDEAGVLLYTPAIWQSPYTAESLGGAIAACIRSVQHEDRQVG